MYNISINDFDFKLLELQNNFYKNVFSKIDFIKKVLKHYDNKVINKRIETKLNNENDDKNFYYCLNKKYDNWELVIYTQNRSYQTKPDKNGVCGSVYIDDDRFYIIDFYKKDILIYDEIVKIIDDKINYRLEQLKKQNETLKNLETLLKNRNRIINELEENTKKLKTLRCCFNGYESIIYDKIR